MAERLVRPIRIEGQVAYVPLTRGYEAIIDAEDVPLIEGWNWCAMVNSTTAYGIRAENNGGKKSKVYIHRVLMGNPDGWMVDHRDCNGLNNRRANLRLATASQNQGNRRLSNRNTSGFKGVSWHKADAKWQAYIRLNDRKQHLGSFETPGEAHTAYVEAAARFYGEFARGK
jgi:hypothetical protein